tara:strand:+ start:205 stop:714 length:510 start_codon:yes stop_codon:yes gene_type:complete
VKYSKEQLQQLALFYAAAQLDGASLDLDLATPPQSLLDQIEEQTGEIDVRSRAQLAISKCLNEIGVDHKLEVSPFDDGKVNFKTNTMLNVDILIENVDYQKVALEFNGPSHYVVSESGQDEESGQTKFKRRLLEGLGFTVVAVHWEDWRKATDAKTEVDFLKELTGSFS